MHYQFFKKNIYIAILLVLLSIFFTTSSIFWTSEIVDDRAHLKHVEFGWPLQFIIQNQERLDPPFPYKMTMVLETPTQLRYIPFFLNITLNIIFIILVSGLVNVLKNKVRGNTKKIQP